MIRTIVCGASGKMGRRICALVGEDKDLTLVGAVEAKGSSAIGQDAGVLATGVANGIAVKDDLAKVIEEGEVVIDFTAPDATLHHVRIASDHKKPIVIGTTGLHKDQIKEIEKLSVIIPIVLAPNMSLGVNILFKLVEEVARTLKDDYDIEIVEMHHRFKADAPSGTALKLAEFAAKGIGEDLENIAIYGRKGLVGQRNSKEIGIMSLRGGDVVGDHTVIFAGLGERVELTHKASSRDTFARGALRAAKWVVDKVPGLYSMQDVLGLK
ncbi:4-hydroxy-tetrahydrodipicolinate reductase [Hippea maritima]|uniref:4-hydroxy-tetrahydrodipicolinate reductase n=1 Tax=Hippea maritima (strain ATCC 700847 / DSM 10411 / MH2) TaxID=760142 RepID=F2LXY1_HIPMA|nr:4-hydroxy-tetrahydrodipicolinate reductase [Hippea maritima]AEA33246.1 Dihydrodipicolinate reductase [Hippea maritima DSM 10411]